MHTPQHATSVRRTFVLHLTYSILVGLLEGTFYLNEFILLKSLHGSNVQVAFLFQFSVVILLFSVFVTEITRRFRNKRRMIRTLAVFTHLPLMLFAFYPPQVGDYAHLWVYQGIFLLIFLINFSARPVVYPAITAMLKTNYGPSLFGKLYGYATTFNKLAIMVAAFTFGVLLDYDAFSFVWVYPLVGGLGLLAVWLLASIPFADEAPTTRQSVLEASLGSMRYMRHILRTNLPFRDFEIGFMLYGFAWMMSLAVSSIFFERELGLNYTSSAFYKNAYNLLSIALLPFISKRIDRMDPRIFGVYTFVAFLLHNLFLALTSYFPAYVDIGDVRVYYLLAVSYLFYAVFASTMGLLWFIGAAYFCKANEAGHYQSMHLSFVGVRAAFVPLMGVYFLDSLGFAAYFLICAALLALAAYVMWWSALRRPINGPVGMQSDSHTKTQ